MYLHINKNCVIKNDSVIGIFSIDNINIDDFENIKDNIEDLSDGTPKTFILTMEDGKAKGYILKLNAETIKKRKI